jgi:hypothetical protein
MPFYENSSIGKGDSVRGLLSTADIGADSIISGGVNVLDDRRQAQLEAGEN